MTGSTQPLCQCTCHTRKGHEIAYRNVKVSAKSKKHRILWIVGPIALLSLLTSQEEVVRVGAMDGITSPASTLRVDTALVGASEINSTSMT